MSASASGSVGWIFEDPKQAPGELWIHIGDWAQQRYCTYPVQLNGHVNPADYDALIRELLSIFAEHARDHERRWCPGCRGALSGDRLRRSQQLLQAAVARHSRSSWDGLLRLEIVTEQLRLEAADAAFDTEGRMLTTRLSQKPGDEFVCWPPPGFSLVVRDGGWVPQVPKDSGRNVITVKM